MAQYVRVKNKKNHQGEGGGQFAFYPDPDVMAKKIEEYFLKCPDKRTIYFNNKTGVIEKVVPNPTVAGLALFLGFKSEQSLRDYVQRDEEKYSCIKRAYLQLKNEYEKRGMENPKWASFVLSNMDKFWRERTEQDINITKVPTDEEIDAEITEILQRREK